MAWGAQRVGALSSGRVSTIMVHMIEDPPPHPHRKRCKRYDVPYQAHYLTFSCFGRKPFLSRDRPRRWFLESLDAARLVNPFDLWGFVLMPEHVHMLILPHEGSRISAILTSIKQPVTQRCVAWVRQNAPSFLSAMADAGHGGRTFHRLWLRGGGYDRNVWSTKDIHEKLRYIHENPVRRGLVDRAEDWPWSSARAWQEGIDTPIRIDRETFPILVS